jgi:hypothetical protein
MPLASSSAQGRDTELVCTLEGGLDAMRDRIGEWQAVIGLASRRITAPGGVTLVYNHDAAITVELARLAAAEFACCSFFEFILVVSPDGVAFTVAAPPEASNIVDSVFGLAAATTAGSH